MDRRTIWAILLMMTIAIVPAIFLKKPVAPAARGGEAGKQVGQTVGPADSSAGRSHDSISAAQPGRDTSKAVASPPAGLPAEHIVHVTSPLYTYGISTRGGRLVEATLPRYRSMAPADRGSPAQILPPDSKLLGLTLVLGRDTVALSDWPFTVSAESLSVKEATPLRLTATRNNVKVDLTYTFQPDDYRVGVSGNVTGVGPNGGLL